MGTSGGSERIRPPGTSTVPSRRRWSSPHWRRLFQGTLHTDTLHSRDFGPPPEGARESLLRLQAPDVHPDATMSDPSSSRFFLKSLHQVRWLRTARGTEWHHEKLTCRFHLARPESERLEVLSYVAKAAVVVDLYATKHICPLKPRTSSARHASPRDADTLRWAVRGSNTGPAGCKAMQWLSMAFYNSLRCNADSCFRSLCLLTTCYSLRRYHAT